jgi:O-acetylhomoserine (thiol)-lyase
VVEPRSARFDTLAIHAGASPDPATGARSVPIHLTTSYVFDDTEHAADLFDLARAGHIYTRMSNPTVAVLETRIAALEGAVAAVATASGQAAIHLAIATLMGVGSHVVASSALYGGTVNLLNHTLPRFGIESTLVHPRDLAAVDAAFRPETRLLMVETIGNPGLEVADLPAMADMAHRHGVPLLVDNTFATPALCRPVEHGADLVVHSATKWLAGHGAVIAGLLVDGGTFDWERSARFPTLTERYEPYGVVFAEEFGPAAFAMRARAEGLRDFGACMDPVVAWLVLQGMETLTARMERHQRVTTQVVEFLGSHPAVGWVSHPDLPSHPDHEIARRLLPDGAGSMVSFGVRGGRDAGRRFIESCRLASHLANVGDVRTLVIHPASTTHRQMSAEQLTQAGIGEDMVRLSVGLEDPDDICDDLGRALRALQAG